MEGSKLYTYELRGKSGTVVFPDKVGGQLIKSTLIRIKDGKEKDKQIELF